MITVNQFETACTAQGVIVHQDVLQAAQNSTSNIPACYEPGPFWSAVAMAGRVLRKRPYQKLADQAINLTAGMESDVVVRSLATMINSSVNPVVPDANRFSYTTDQPAHSIAACSDAEKNFRTTVETLQYHAPRPKTPGCDIVVDALQRPLFLRKSAGEPSTLTLQEVLINGVAYPPGSIVKMTTYNDPVSVGGIRYPKITYGAITVLSASDVDTVTFKRLSTFVRPDSSVALAAHRPTELAVLADAVQGMVTARSGISGRQ